MLSPRAIRLTSTLSLAIPRPSADALALVALVAGALL